MLLRIEVPPELLRTLRSVASARGATVEEFVAAVLADAVADGVEVPDTVREPIAEHGEVLDRLSET